MDRDTVTPQAAGGPWVCEVHDVIIRFGTFTAVDGVSLTIAPGEVFGLLRPNGSGKTTLIRALCGLLPLASGWARVLGRDVTRDAEAIRAQVGYMSQRFSLYEDLTARENMDFYCGIYGLTAADARRRQQELVEIVGLGPYLDRRAGRLSGGWKQRLALACSVLHRPRLVFLDEPTAGIDPVARRDLWDLLFRLSAEGVSLLVTTHYMDEAERCARVGYLYLGHLLALGSPAELTRMPQVTPPGTRHLEIHIASLAGRDGIQRQPGQAASSVATVLERLRHHPGVRHATIFGQAIHALVNEDCTAEDLGLPGAEVRPAEPSLEDVFVALSRAQDT